MLRIRSMLTVFITLLWIIIASTGSALLLLAFCRLFKDINETFKRNIEELPKESLVFIFYYIRFN